jgi:hypothetical protein
LKEKVIDMGEAEDAVRLDAMFAPILHRAYIYSEVMPKIVEHGQLLRRELDRLRWRDAIIGSVRISKSSRTVKDIALFGIVLEGWTLPTVHVGSDGVVYTEQAVGGVVDPSYDSGGYLLYARCPITDNREIHTYQHRSRESRKDAPHILEKLEETLVELRSR